MWVQRVGEHPAAVSGLRSSAEQYLSGCGADATAADVGLIMTELITNVIVHGGLPGQASIEVLDEVVRCEVSDAGTGMPQMKPIDPMRIGGNGLRLVAAFSASWGVKCWSPEGKTVWCEVPRRAAPAA